MEASCWKTRPDTRIERCFHLTHTEEDWEWSRGHFFLCVCVILHVTEFPFFAALVASASPLLTD